MISPLTGKMACSLNIYENKIEILQVKLKERERERERKGKHSDTKYLIKFLNGSLVFSKKHIRQLHKFNIIFFIVKTNLR